MKMLLAILLGNLVYFVLKPYLPDYLKHSLYTVDPGYVLDLTICIILYLAIRVVV
jgi:hypothetical protein